MNDVELFHAALVGAANNRTGWNVSRSNNHSARGDFTTVAGYWGIVIANREGVWWSVWRPDSPLRPIAGPAAGDAADAMAQVEEFIDRHQAQGGETP